MSLTQRCERWRNEYRRTDSLTHELAAIRQGIPFDADAAATAARQGEHQRLTGAAARGFANGDATLESIKSENEILSR